MRITKRDFTETFYPDNQIHIGLPDIEEGQSIVLQMSIQHSNDLVRLMMATNAIDRMRGRKHILRIPYLMGARYDRPMDHQGSFDLKVIAELINRLEFERVQLFDPHSDVSIALIDNSETMDLLYASFIKTAVPRETTVVIVPDAGAQKKVLCLSPILPSKARFAFVRKSRNTATGDLMVVVSDEIKDYCSNQHCVIIDDICDGGGTFNAISQQLGDSPYSLRLIVSHGIFSKGMDQLAMEFEEVITTNSYSSEIYHDALKTVNLF